MNAKFLPAVLLGLLLSCDRQVGESAGPSDTYTLSPRIQLMNATTLPEVDSVRILVQNENNPSAAAYFDQTYAWDRHGDTIRGIPRDARILVKIAGLKRQGDGTMATWWSGRVADTFAGTFTVDARSLTIPVAVGDTAAPGISSRSGDTVEAVDSLVRLTWSVSGDTHLLVVVAGDTIRRLGDGGDSVVWTRKWTSGDTLQVQASFRDSTGNVRLDTVRAVRRQRVRAPVFLTPAGNYSDTVRIRFSDSTLGASLEASLDTGRTWRPADAGILLGSDALVQVRATKPGWTSSAIREGSFQVRAAAPEFYPPGSRYDTTQLVAISTPTAGASIRYTTDGTEPTSASLLYAGPVRIAVAQTLKARTYKPGLDSSGTAEAVYVIDTVQAPAIGLRGGDYDGPQTVSVTCATARSEIRYTLDGTVPTASSALYGGPVQVAGSSTLRAAAFRTGMISSPVVQETYRIAALAPTFQPPGGRYDTTQLVAISTPTAGASIRYTTDGTEPTAASLLYAGPVRVAVAQTLKARAFRSGLENSGTGVADYVIDTVATPVIAPDPGSYLGFQTVTLRCATAGATLYYTLDGLDPDGNSDVYTGPFTLQGSGTLKVRALKPGRIESAVASARYTLRVQAPTFVGLKSDTIHARTDLTAVRFASATPGASFLWSTDSLQWNPYVDSVVLGRSCTLYAKAVRTAMDTSAVSKVGFSIAIAAPVPSPADGSRFLNDTSLTFSIAGSATSGVQIRYTLDGSAPTSASSLYSAPIPLTGNVTVKARSFKAGMDSGSVVAAGYRFAVDSVRADVPSGHSLTAPVVTLSTSTSSAEIHYTLDGSTPTRSSPTYTGPLVLSYTTPKLVVRALAVRSGFDSGWSRRYSYVHGDVFTDVRDSKVYPYVLIGSQKWMARNLDFATGKAGEVCYGNDAANCDRLGRLYDWATAMDVASGYNTAIYGQVTGWKGICPSGWHLPDTAEWGTLERGVGKTQAGMLLRSDSGWATTGGVAANGTDLQGFAALPAGSGGSAFYGLGSSTNFQSSTERQVATEQYQWGMSADYPGFGGSSGTKSAFYSVRCIGD